ncbi:MAG: biotin--[acetyl-CoA-carboxylase] ligase [Chloroflexi bacterium]|nr:biotin--[acetyl-CoA-carboxylase] ligase [Chloroflexota bacterium]
MNARTLTKTLSKLDLGGLRYFDSIGSTNDEALAWAAQGAPDLSIVVADEQTSGRGREGRRWFTPAGTALAFSLILRPTAEELPHLSRTVGLAAVALAESMRKRSLIPQIKWPNDLLLSGQKVAGILVESVWSGEAVDCTVIGVGVNVARAAIPPPELLQFPAVSLEDALGSLPKREAILHDILSELLAWRPLLGSEKLLKTWEERLAFRGERVQITGQGAEIAAGKVLGLEADGSLRLRDERGNPVTVRFGDVRLRPAT